MYSCEKCKKRKVGCHANCAKYKAEKTILALQKKKSKKIFSKAKYMNDYNWKY